jgi:hypothetical protein
VVRTGAIALGARLTGAVQFADGALRQIAEVRLIGFNYFSRACACSELQNTQKV